MRLKILIVAICSFFFIFCNGLNAMWAKMSHSKLIEKSAIVLIGEMIGKNQVTFSNDQRQRCIGVLKVQKILKGNKEQSVIFLQMPCKIVKSDDIIYKKGQQGIWFLRLRSNGEQGIYIADNPQRFIPLEKAEKDLAEIKKIISEQVK